MKKTIILFLFICLCTSIAFAQSNMKLIVNSSVMPTEKGHRKGAAVMVPLKPITEKIGTKLIYDLRDRRVKLMKKGLTAIFYVGEKQITINGEKIMTPFPAEIINEKVYVPVGFLTDYLDCQARIDSKKNIIFISTSANEKNSLNNEDGGIKDIDDFDI